MSAGNGHMLGPVSQLLADVKAGTPYETAYARYQAGVTAMDKALADRERRYLRAIVDERLVELGLIPAPKGGSTDVG